MDLSVLMPLMAGACTGSALLLLMLRKEIAPFSKKPSWFPIKEVKALLQEKKKLEEESRTLLQNLIASVIIRDRNGKTLLVSPYSEVLFGYPLASFYRAEDDFIKSLIHEDDHEIYERSQRVASNGEPFQCRYRFHHRSGIELWAESRIMPLETVEGEFTGTLTITLEVTSSVLYQKQVEERNRDVQDFTYMISHDLKAPLFTLRGMLSILEEDLSPTMNSEIAANFRHVTRSMNRLEALVSSVLEYAKISVEGFSIAPVNLHEVVEEVLYDFAPSIERANVCAQITGVLPQVLGDKFRLSQIFANLVSNALKYRHPERQLVLDIYAKAARTDRYVIIAVKDNGLGIPTQKLDSIFRPFYRAHGAGIEGSGIGLASVKKLLEKLSGTIEVTSTEGEGTEFTITLRKV